MPALVPPGLEVIAHRRAVHAVRLGLDGQLDELARGELFRRRLVSQLEFSHVTFLPLGGTRYSIAADTEGESGDVFAADHVVELTLAARQSRTRACLD